MFYFFLPHALGAYDAAEVVRKNPGIARRLEFLKKVNLQRRVSIALIGDYIHIDRFHSSMAFNTGEIKGNHKDDDQNGYEDDYFGLDLRTGHGRLNSPVVSGHENGIMSLLDAFIKDSHLEAFIKVIPINIVSENRRFDDLYLKKLADAIDYARVRGAKVISMSLAVPADSPAFFQFLDKNEYKSRGYYVGALRRAEQAGIILLGATSNDPDRDLLQDPVAPANSPGVISVANVNFEGVLQSAYGRNVDLAFYGTDIFVWRGDLEGTQVVKGASLATPLVALTLAVAKSLKPNLRDTDLASIKAACEKKIIGQKKISSGCIYSPRKFIESLKTPEIYKGASLNVVSLGTDRGINGCDRKNWLLNRPSC